MVKQKIHFPDLQWGKLIILHLIFLFTSVLTFSQNSQCFDGGIEKDKSRKSRLRINKNEDGVVRGNGISSQNETLIESSIISYENDAIYSSRKPEDELEELRDRTSKHFRNPDGSIEAFLSTGSLNYNENGNWHTIERAIVTNNTGKYAEFGFANTKNVFKSFYACTPAYGIKTIIGNNEITEWQNKKIEFYDAEMNLRII